jgi:3-methylfumaryl-CoA hydratase
VSDPAEGTVECHGLLVPEPAVALAGVLDVDPPASGPEDALPPLWHWIYLLEPHREDQLGPDGHPRHGIPAPPGPGRLRMFAGGRITTLAPLRLGEYATRVTRVASTTQKQGRSGPLTFTTVRSAFLQAGEVAVVEEQDIVYREPGSRLREAPSAANIPESESLEFDVDPVLLFRFSALTYNAHRIHYDREYAKGEGYPDLVVHGPLQALLMAERLRRSGISLLRKEFGYRLLAPTFGSQRLTVTHRHAGEAVEASVHDATGVLTATARLAGADVGAA